MTVDLFLYSVCSDRVYRQSLYPYLIIIIIRFPFPPTCFFGNTTKFSLCGNLHRMDFHIFTNFSLLHWWGFWYCFLKILVIMNNEKWPPACILFWKPWNGNLIFNFAWPKEPAVLGSGARQYFKTSSDSSCLEFPKTTWLSLLFAS